jgi:predicted Zn-dependent peptidase
MVEFNRKKLSNGLTVIHEKRDVSVTTVMMAVKYGSMFESVSEKGIAHYMEHLCFKGTEKRDTREIAASLERVGGDLNAFTHEEMTAYHVRLPSQHLELGVDVISDIFFNPNFPEAEVDKEGNVICEEIRMYHDNPRAHTLEKIKENLYEAPYGMFIAGTEENVRGMNKEQLLKKHRSIYIPENSVLCVVGNNSFEDVILYAEKYANISRDGIEIKDDLDVKKRIRKGEEERNEVMQSNLAIGFHFPSLGDRQRSVALVFSTILGDGMSSKLFSEVREKRGLVYTVKTDLDIGRNYGYMLIFAGTEDSKVEEVVKICLEEYEKMGEISEEELSEAKIQAIGNHLVESEGSNEAAVNLVLEEFSGRAEDYYDYSKKINAVTLDDIKEMAKKVNYSSFVLGPKK